MAKLADYEVPPATPPGAREEWEAFLETLHRSGTLRVLNGFFGKLGPVSDIALENLNSASGRNIVGAALALGEIAGRCDAATSQSLATGAIDGANRSRRYHARPPGLWRLVRLLFAPDTRRALGTVLTLLNRIGAALREPSSHEKGS